MKFRNAYKDYFEVVVVNCDDSSKKQNDYLKQYSFKYATPWSNRKKKNSETRKLCDKVNVRGFPTVLLLGKDAEHADAQVAIRGDVEWLPEDQIKRIEKYSKNDYQYSRKRQKSRGKTDAQIEESVKEYKARDEKRIKELRKKEADSKAAKKLGDNPTWENLLNHFIHNKRESKGGKLKVISKKKNATKD